MATKTITFTANAWKYPGINGIQHTVTTSQTATFTLTDGGASAVTYVMDGNQSVTTTDGRKIVFQADAENSTNGTGNGNTGRSFGPTADAEDGLTLYSKRGRFIALDPETHIRQHWVAQKIITDDTDTPTSITATFEDQFGNTFTWTALGIS